MKHSFSLMLALAVISGKATAQEEIPLEHIQALNRVDREILHPGNPLQVEGLDQGDNQFRADTPALAGGEVSATMIDMQEMRTRKIAMYTKGMTFDRPPARSNRMTVSDPKQRMATFSGDRPPVPVEEPAPDPAQPWRPFVIGGVCLAALLGLIRLRR